MKFVWGVSGMDFETFDEYQPDDFPGVAVYDPSFDLSTKEAQEAVLNTCQKLRSLSCNLPGCRGGSNLLILKQGSKMGISCFLEDMRRWLQATQSTSDLPTGPQFLKQLDTFRRTASPGVYGEPGELLDVNYKEEVGFISGRLRYVAVTIRSTLPAREPFGSGIDVRNLVDEFVQAQRATMPVSMQSFTVASDRLANYDLGAELVSGLFTGFAIAGPIAFLVLLLSTRNIIMAFYAVISVASIVVSVLGFCKSAMDYDLGIGEAIAGVIVIGYSVDYVVHLAHIYCEAAEHGLETRDDRSAFAIKNMGSTVFAGAITTAGSGMFMFLCVLTFFFKMALLICMTIFFSFMFSLFFFMALVFMIGPQSTFGNLSSLCCRGERHAK